MFVTSIRPDDQYKQRGPVAARMAAKTGKQWPQERLQSGTNVLVKTIDENSKSIMSGALITV